MINLNVAFPLLLSSFVLLTGLTQFKKKNGILEGRKMEVQPTFPSSNLPKQQVYLSLFVSPDQLLWQFDHLPEKIDSFHRIR